VFVSHAREDNDRFVLDFAARLRSEQGLDAFVDVWEIKPGDSLVEKIFDDGIGRAEAVIVVISEHSINKPWVRKELDVSTVMQIEDDLKLIPVVIGNIERHQMPTSLRDTLWVRVGDLDNYDAELSEVVAKIYDRYEKPPIGEQAEYTRADLGVVPDLRLADSQVLKLCCEMGMQRGERGAGIDGDELVKAAEIVGLHEKQVLRSVTLLAGRSLIDARTRIGSKVPARVVVTDYGFDEYAHTFIPGYSSLKRAIGLEIVNRDADRSDEIAQAIDSSQVIVEHVLALFEVREWLRNHQATLPWMEISNVSPELEYWLEETA